MKTISSVFSFFLLMLTYACGQVIEADSKVSIQIRGVPTAEQQQIDGDYMVSRDGTLNLPFVGVIRAAGLNSDTLQRSIADAYRRAEIYQNPTITVMYSDTAKIGKTQQVSVGGKVAKQGPVQFQNGLTLFDAVTAAGGRNTFGSRRVRVYRGSKMAEFDITNPEHMTYKLAPGDRIVVQDLGLLEKW